VKKALITGLTGQDGSYLAELLLEQGYQVFGLVRRSSSGNADRISHLSGTVEILSGDLLDQCSLMDAISYAQPDEIYNLASQSYVPLSWILPWAFHDYWNRFVAVKQMLGFTKLPVVKCSDNLMNRPKPSELPFDLEILTELQKLTRTG
jgi:GDP-D-mannose dehydratase